ncbi:MAG: glycosyl hydrolase family 18 protein, partial [Patescibacteria group bacterium]
VLVAAALAPLAAHAAAPLEISAWLPYWRTASSTKSALAHLPVFKEINPFGYTVTADGLILDSANIVSGGWDELIVAAKAKKIRVIPTLMWSDGAAMHRILSNQKTRIALEDAITALVYGRDFDGIDIDFEGKWAETKDYYSTFLKGLYMRMGQKWVMCEIEARTPLDSRYDGTPPPDAGQYANDYVEITKYCDRVRIMAYDQGAIDVKLNRAASGKPYVPVADPKWVEKVILETAKTIPKRKLVLGVPTYGYEYAVTPLSEQGYRYDLQWAFNQKYAFDLMQLYHPSIQRNSAGELSFSYIPNVFPDAPPAGTESAALTNNPGLPVSVAGGAGIAKGGPAFNIVWWSDMSAIRDKIALAKKHGLRGVAIFKIDGGEDPALWDILK